jgi:hypothetical protein
VSNCTFQGKKRKMNGHIDGSVAIYISPQTDSFIVEDSGITGTTGGDEDPNDYPYDHPING